ncbi:MAG: ComF family protein [candidate division SR1 bacterium]|nr:ComF family protein [candidate division SR1 bacterium]
MIFNKYLNLFFPLQNYDFTNIDRYLSEKEILNCHSRLKKLTIEQSRYLESIYVMSNYTNKIVFDLIKRSKYNNEWKICDVFAYSIYYKIFVNGEIFIPDPQVLIPVPADFSRFIQRGYNVPSCICKVLSKKINIPVIDIFIKKRNTISQNKLDKKSRLNNLNNVFKINQDIKYNFSNIEIVWIVDDVSTTGTTLLECAKTIKKSFPYLKIYGIVISSN